MELTNEFEVSAPIEQAWRLLTDIERIAPCVPGFQLKGVENGEYSGTMKVKVGAVQTTYNCVVRFVERDDRLHRAVIAAQGKEARGQGGVTADIVSTLTEAGVGQTHASVVTTLNVTGRVAQFGRGILADVSNRLVKQFVTQLEAEVLEPQPMSAAADGNPGGVSGGDSAGDQAEDGGVENAAAHRAGEQQAGGVEPLDLLSVAGLPLIKRAAIAVALALAAGMLIALLRPRGAR